jgi:CRP-like cAMP-binding protein
MTTDRSRPNGRNRLLAALLPADFALLESHLKDMHFKQGVVLQEAGGRIEQVYFPHTGMISLLAVMQAGNGVETATIGREGVVGAMAGLGGRIAVARAVVQVEGSSSQISVSRFQTAVGESAGIRALIERYNDVQMGLINQSAGCNALHQLESRLCRWLLQTRDRSDSDTLTLTQEFLSEMLGVQRTTVNLLARELQSAGLIRYRRARIEIVDRAGLEKKACECYEVVRRRNEDVFSNLEEIESVPISKGA